MVLIDLCRAAEPQPSTLILDHYATLVVFWNRHVDGGIPICLCSLGGAESVDYMCTELSGVAFWRLNFESASGPMADERDNSNLPFPKLDDASISIKRPL